jgi:parallel beta-helix repeat protein
VTIRNGSIRGFSAPGVYVSGTRQNRVERLDVAESGDGVVMIDSAASTIERVAVAGSAFVGIAVNRSHDIRIVRNVVTATRGSGGIFASADDHVLIARNTTASGPDSDGITLARGSTAVVVRENAVFANGGGIGLHDADGNLITGNAIHDNAFIGAYDNGGDDNRFERNVIARNGDGSGAGIELDVSDGNGGTADRNILWRNVLVGNGGDGIRVDPGQVETRIERNLATQNTGDGFDIRAIPTLLARNVATRNGELGIRAIPGVTDGGGNRASANGDPLQCVNVACRP